MEVGNPLGGRFSGLRVEVHFGVRVATGASTANRSHSRACSACMGEMELPECSQVLFMEGSHFMIKSQPHLSSARIWGVHRYGCN